MYSRRIGDTVYTFEPSGGLLNAALVMQDRETDSYWSIIREEALAGPAEGQRLATLAGAVKTTFGEWRTLHPDTRVLSVEGREHDPKTPYDRYFDSEQGFRGLEAADDRLADKAPIFAFEDAGGPRAVPHGSFAGGGTVESAGRSIFLYRRGDDSHYRSTVAYLAPEGGRFVHREGGWMLVVGDLFAPFDPEARRFVDGPAAAAVDGFDTFWYIWSTTHGDTGVLRASRAAATTTPP